jgi:soluble lytic murein transglycosylase-like protein
MKRGIRVALASGKLRPGGYMQSLLLKLQEDVAARKQPRSEVWPAVRALCLILVLFTAAYELGARSVDSSAGWAMRASTRERLQALSSRVEAQKGELALQRAYIQRLEQIHRRSAKYGIGTDLAAAIEDIALAEKVDPDLAFELVRVESRFKRTAVSPVGALGYTQLMPSTARLLSPGITRKQIFERDTNLRLGFRFFRYLLDRYNGDVRLALLAYNRGPARVDQLLAAGVDPANGYARMVLGQ